MSEQEITIRVGSRFERLLVLEMDNRNVTGETRWLCQCDCGTQKTVRAYNLKAGHTRSCGCLQRESATRHGMDKSPEYNAWHSLRSRCKNEKVEDAS